MTKAKEDLPPALVARYHPSALFSLSKSEIGTGWHLVIPGELKDKLWWGRPNHSQKWVRRRLLAVDRQLPKVRPINDDKAKKIFK
jgi:hypothetical protein